MAWENPMLMETAVADADLSANQYLAVSNAGTLAQLTSDNATTFTVVAGNKLVVVLNGATLRYDFDGTEVDTASMLAALNAAPVFAGLISFSESPVTSGAILFTAVPSSLAASMEVTVDDNTVLFTSLPAGPATGSRQHGVVPSTANPGDTEVLGILQNTPDEGETAAVAVSGRSKAVAGAVPINTGDPVVSAADGKFRLAVATELALGTAVTPALSVDDVFTVHLDKQRLPA